MLGRFYCVWSVGEAEVCLYLLSQCFVCCLSPVEKQPRLDVYVVVVVV